MADNTSGPAEAARSPAAEIFSNLFETALAKARVAVENDPTVKAAMAEASRNPSSANVGDLLGKVFAIASKTIQNEAQFDRPAQTGVPPKSDWSEASMDTVTMPSLPSGAHSTRGRG